MVAVFAGAGFRVMLISLAQLALVSTQISSAGLGQTQDLRVCPKPVERLTEKIFSLSRKAHRENTLDRAPERVRKHRGT